MTRTNELPRTLTRIAGLCLLASCQTHSALPVGLSGPGEPVETKRAPESLAEMRALQEKILAVTPDAVASTVSVLVGRNQGSGVIVSPGGLVLTAAHVIGGPDERAWIWLPDGTRLRGHTLELNERRDTGMIQIDDPGPWPFAQIADERENAPVGTWCIAIGHPQGFQRGRAPVVRVGRVTAERGDFLQTDCPIYSGDSGGPLFDLRGKIIGIHSRIRENIAFNLHVPAPAFLRDWNFLLASGPVLGIECADLENGEGAVVTAVFRGMAADRAQIVPGDVILAVDGQAVADVDALVSLLGRHEVGQHVDVVVRRENRELTLPATLGRRP